MCIYIPEHPNIIVPIESYGGHYGPSFVTYFDEQNAAIAAGTLTGVPIVVSAMMINKYVVPPVYSVPNAFYVAGGTTL